MKTTQFTYQRATSTATPIYHRGGPMVPYRGDAGGIPPLGTGQGGPGGGGGNQNTAPIVNPQTISWWWIPLGVAGIVETFAWIVSRK